MRDTFDIMRGELIFFFEVVLRNGVFVGGIENWWLAVIHYPDVRLRISLPQLRPTLN